MPFSEQQGVAWESALEADSHSLGDNLEPLYAVPHKEQHKFSLDEFILHKMLGKGSFGKVASLIWTERFLLNKKGYVFIFIYIHILIGVSC